jgi:hypothetical protein
MSALYRRHEIVCLLPGTLDSAALIIANGDLILDVIALDKLNPFLPAFRLHHMEPEMVSGVNHFLCVLKPQAALCSVHNMATCQYSQRGLRYAQEVAHVILEISIYLRPDPDPVGQFRQSGIKERLTPCKDTFTPPPVDAFRPYLR